MPEPYESAVERVAQAERLTLVVGAGSSLQSGLPTWRELVQRLLHQVAQKRGLGSDEQREFVDWVVSRDDLIPAASIAREMLGPEFESSLRTALYVSAPNPEPGMAARAIARLHLLLMGSGSEVVTTNYDTLVEAALSDLLAETWWPTVRPVVRTYVGPASARSPALPVRHLHGVLTPRGRVQGKLVLSEADYHLMQDRGQWQETYFSSRLQRSLCVFTGTSFTDPNLLRYLYRTKSGTEHVALFARQQDADLYERAPASVQRAREETAAARWASMGIEPITLNHFADGPQFLWELAHRLQDPKGYRPLGLRLEEFDSRAKRAFLPANGRSFAVRQDRLQRFLQRAVEFLVAQARHHDMAPRRRERLACSLWLYRPGSEELLNLASSDRLWRDRRTLQPVPIVWHTDFAAIQAFCSGSTVSLRTDTQATTRWNHVLGQALHALGSKSQCLPVGVVTWTSTEPEERSFWWEMRQRQPSLLEQVGEVLADLLIRGDD